MCIMTTYNLCKKNFDLKLLDILKPKLYERFSLNYEN